MKKLLTILLVLISFSSFAQFEAGEYINSDTVKIDGVPLLLNTFKQGNLGGASNIFYSTGASSQPASGSVNQVIGNNYIQNQNSSAQDANFWINGSIKSTSVNLGLDEDIRWGGGYASGHPLILGSPTAIHMYPGGNTYSGNVYINTEKVYHAGNSNRSDVNWRANQFTSHATTGTPPLVVASSTKVDNLNVSFLEGHPASYFETANVNIQRHITNDNDTIIGNEYQNLSNSKTENNIAVNISNGTGTIFSVADADSSITNEIQDLSRSNDTLYLSLDATPVVLNDFQKDSDTLTWDATKKDLADSIKYIKKYAIGDVSISVSGERLALNKTRIIGGSPITDTIQRVTVDHDGLMTKDQLKRLTDTVPRLSGTLNYLQKVTGTNTIGNSSIIDNGSMVTTSLQFSSTHSLSAPTHYAGTSYFNPNTFELGYGQTGNRYALIDLTGDDTYSDYGLRILRNSTGADAFSALYHRGKGDFAFITQDAAPITFTTKGVTGLTIDTLQNSGFGTLTPAARIHSQSTATQARLGYDATKYTDLTTGSTGDLTIDPTGDTVKVVGAVNSTGGFSTTAKSNLNDVTGDSAVFANMKMTYGAGINKIIYSDATGNFIWGNQSSTLLAIAGVTPSTGYLYYNGSNFSYASGGSAQWTADTYGIKYTAGKVGIGIGSDSGNLLTVGDGSTNTNIAISASSLNQRAIFATSGSNTAIVGQGGLDGVYGVGTRYGIQGSSLNGNGVRGASANVAGVSGTSTYSYGGEFSGLGVNISSGGLLINGTTRISSTGTFTPSNGASGSFTSADGKTITVTNGIITGIN